MTPDPDLTGPPEYQPDEDPGDDDAALFAAAAYELAGWEFIEQQQRTKPILERCRRCDHARFEIWYDPTAQGRHIQCEACAKVYHLA